MFYLWAWHSRHGWELPGNYPVFTVLMVIYRYVEIIGELFLPPIFLYNLCYHEKYHPCEPVNIHMPLLLNIIQENNRVVITQKVRGKLTLFCGNRKLLFPIYGPRYQYVDLSVGIFLFILTHYYMLFLILFMFWVKSISFRTNKSF